MDNTNPLKFLSLKEAGETLGLDTRTVVRLIQDGQLRGVDTGTPAKPHWRISIAAIAEFGNVADLLQLDALTDSQLGILPPEVDPR